MNVSWRLFGSAAAAGAIIAVFVSHTGAVAGDTSTSQGPPPVEDRHEPFTPYDLGPGAITYDQLSDADKAGVNAIQQTEDLAQPPSSYQAFSDGAIQTALDAQAQIAARQVGLVGTEQDGVTP